MSIQLLNDSPVTLFGIYLFDSGSTSTLINTRAVPTTATVRHGANQMVTTTQGTYNSTEYFNAEKLSFPECFKTRFIPLVHLRTFDSPTSHYDFIVGRDILKYGFIINHAQKRIEWDGLSIPMTSTSQQSSSPVPVTQFSCKHTLYESHAAAVTKIKHTKYELFNPQDVATHCDHLLTSQQHQLSDLLVQFPTLFPGKLGRYNKTKYSLVRKDPKTLTIFCKPYPVPQTHMNVFQQELHHLVDKGVLQKITRSEWSFPRFIIPKKDASAHHLGCISIKDYLWVLLAILTSFSQSCIHSSQISLMWNVLSMILVFFLFIPSLITFNLSIRCSSG